MMTPPQQAYFLVAHGSRDSRSQHALNQWVDALRQRLGGCPSLSGCVAPVQLGTLEFAECPLEQQLIHFARSVKAQGISDIAVLPLFLLAGVHVQEDIPVAVALAQQQLGSSIHLHLRPHFGSHANIAQLLQQNTQGLAVDCWILLSHGTRRMEGQSAVEAIATQLGWETAYWSVSPHLDERLIQLHDANRQKKIGIVPYFVVTGGILDSISAEIYTLKSKSNKFSFTIAPTLQPNAIAIDFLMDLCTLSGQNTFKVLSQSPPIASKS